MLPCRGSELGASPGGIGFEQPVEPERFSGCAGQRLERHREGVDQPQSVARAGG